MLNETLYNRYLEALLKGDRAQCHDLVEALAVSDIAIKDIYTHLFQRSLYRVGKLWETNKISVAKEHLATAITEGLFSLVYPRLFASEHCDKKAVISCSANEWHQIGGKMVADIFELHGWDSHFLGANTPLVDLLQYIDEIQPDILGLSLSIRSNLSVLLKMLDAVRADFVNLDIFVGGQAFHWGRLDELRQIRRVQYIASLDDLERTIQA